MGTGSEVRGNQKNFCPSAQIRGGDRGINFLHFIAFLLTNFFPFGFFLITGVTYITANIFPACHLIVAISMFYTSSMSNKVIFIILCITYVPLILKRSVSQGSQGMALLPVASGGVVSHITKVVDLML